MVQTLNQGKWIRKDSYDRIGTRLKIRYGPVQIAYNCRNMTNTMAVAGLAWI
jgi:hypothetical protein